MKGFVGPQARVRQASSYAWNPDILHSPSPAYNPTTARDRKRILAKASLDSLACCYCCCLSTNLSTPRGSCYRSVVTTRSHYYYPNRGRESRKRRKRRAAIIANWQIPKASHFRRHQPSPPASSILLSRGQTLIFAAMFIWASSCCGWWGDLQLSQRFFALEFCFVLFCGVSERASERASDCTGGGWAAGRLDCTSFLGHVSLLPLSTIFVWMLVSSGPQLKMVRQKNFFCRKKSKSEWFLLVWYVGMLLRMAKLHPDDASN